MALIAGFSAPAPLPDPASASRLLAWLDAHNPLGSLEVMKLGHDGAERPPDWDMAAAALFPAAVNTQKSVSALRKRAPRCRVVLSQRAHTTELRLVCLSEDLASLPAFIEFAVQLADQFTVPLTVSVGEYNNPRGPNIPDVYGELIKQDRAFHLPACFMSSPGWLHILHPAFFEYFISRDDLLDTPGVLRTEELPSGAVLIQCYEHPMDFLKPDAEQQMITLSRYWRDKAQNTSWPLRRGLVPEAWRSWYGRYVHPFDG